MSDEQKEAFALKLSGVTLQIIVMLVTIGVIYGKLQSQQDTLNSQLRSSIDAQEAALKKLDDIQNRLTRLEAQVTFERKLQ